MIVLAVGIWAEISFLKTRLVSAYLCAAREGHYGKENVRDKYLNSSRDRWSTLQDPHHTLFLEEELRKRPWKCVLRDARSPRRAECRSKKKNSQKPRAFTLVFNGCDWTVGFRRGLKWRSRRNGENSSKRNPGFGPTVAAANPLKKYGYILYHFLLVFKRFFFTSPPCFHHLRAYARARGFSPRWSPPAILLPSTFPTV